MFVEYFFASGMVLSPEISWITFHSSFDFAYLLKILISDSLPDQEEQFLTQVKTYFPNFYDIKEMKRDIDNLRGGLSRLADKLEIARIGHEH